MARSRSASLSAPVAGALGGQPLAWAGVSLAVVLAVLWVHKLWQTYVATGLFQDGLGDDFANYYAQSRLLHSGDPSAIYRLDALSAQVSDLARYARGSTEPLVASSVPYPPLFAWLFTPFTLVAPPVGFALWTALNLLGLAYLAWRVSRGKNTLTRWLFVALFCTAWPLVYQFSLGQPIVLLACVVAECYLALHAEREVRAGLWLSLLIFRPQYAVLLGALLVWKRRWTAVLAAAAGVLAILLASVAVSSLPTLLEYPRAIQDEGGFRGTSGNPVEFMINWRSLVVLVWPSIADAPGLLLTLGIGAATIAATAWAWRGPWWPRAAAFHVQITVLLLATLIANYHSHVYGAVLLAAPLIATLETPYVNRAMRLLIVCSVLAPSVLAAVGNPVRANHLLTMLLIALFVALVAALRLERAPQEDVGSPITLSAASVTSPDG
jgi:Glycosyltransferase family 87